MATITYTVAGYLAATKPIASGSTVLIVDAGAAIASLSADDMAALSANHVVSLNATDNILSLSVAQMQGLGSVKLNAADVVTLSDADDAIGSLTVEQIESLDARGVDVLAASDHSLHLSNSVSTAIAASGLRFDDSDVVTIDDSGKFGGHTAAQIAALSEKGADLLSVPSGFVNIDQAVALAASNMTVDSAYGVSIMANGADMAKLTPGMLKTLSLKGIDAIGSFFFPSSYSLTLAQYKALDGISIGASDTVTLELNLKDLALLKDSQIADFNASGIDEFAFSAPKQVLLSLEESFLMGLAARNVTVLDAVEDVLRLSLAEYNAIKTLKFASEDDVSVFVTLAEVDALDSTQISEMVAKRVDALVLEATGKVLSGLTPEHLAALRDKGLNKLNASDNKLSLTLEQYNALGGGKLTDKDVVTLSATTDFTIYDEGLDNLILTGNAIYGTGNNLANKMTGNSKDNILNGRSGNDTLFGGKGKDTFVFDSLLNKTSNVDVIKDFSVADDTIQLHRSIFGKLSAGPNGDPLKLGTKFFAFDKAADANDYIIYNRSTGDLSYDADGSGKGSAILFAKLASGLKLTSANFYVTDFGVNDLLI